MAVVRAEVWECDPGSAEFRSAGGRSSLTELRVEPDANQGSVQDLFETVGICDSRDQLQSFADPPFRLDDQDVAVLAQARDVRRRDPLDDQRVEKVGDVHHITIETGIEAKVCTV